MIDTLIFDLGNVVITNDWHDNNEIKFQEFSIYYGIDYDAMEHGWNAAWPKFSIGEMTEDEFWRKFLTKAGANKIDIEKAKELWRVYQKPIDGMFELLKRLKNKYKLGALTKTGREWLDFKRSKFNLDNYFETIVSSGYFGKTKPDKKVYEIVLAKLDSVSNESVFIDDKEKFLIPARKLGMTTIKFTNKQGLIKELENLGLII